MGRVLALGFLVLMSPFASAKTPNDGVRNGESAQIRTSTITVQRPLDRHIDLRLTDASLQTYFENISRQTRLKFLLADGVADCRISAFFRDLPVREAVQLLVETGVGFQQLGNTDTYTIVRGRSRKLICPPRQKAKSTRQCSPKDEPISIDCVGGSLSSFAEILHDQSHANLLVWNDAVNFPINISLKKADYEKAMVELQENTALAINKAGAIEKSAVFVLIPPKDVVESSTVQISTRVVKITPNGSEEFRADR